MCQSCNSTGTATCTQPSPTTYTCTCKLGWANTNCDGCDTRFTGAGCTTCVPGFTGINCDTCRLGLAGVDCDTCAPGYNATTGCTTCLAGYTRLTPSSACQCPANSYISGSGACLPCPSGGTSPVNSRTCSEWQDACKRGPHQWQYNNALRRSLCLTSHLTVPLFSSLSKPVCVQQRDRYLW
jgi:hypothetical protein